jgi:Flp pilus assembly protein TadG
MASMTRTAASGRHSKFWRSDDGAELIEFALVFPTLLLVMLGIIDFGFLFQRYEVVTNAAREGARVAILNGYQDADVQARVAQYLTVAGLTGTSATIVGAPQSITIGSQCITVRPVTVTYDHEFLFLGPIVGLMGGSGFSNKTLRATSSMRTEIAAESCP